MKYLWTEDTGAGLHFWKLVDQLFFDDKLSVESKGSNQGLLDAVLDLEMKNGADILEMKLVLRGSHISVHHHVMAEASAHDEEMEDLVGAEIFML